MLSPEDYQYHVEQVLADIQEALIKGNDVDPAMCVSGLEPNRSENKAIRNYIAKSVKTVTVREFDNALRREARKEALGVDKLPETASDFIGLMVERLAVTARYNGSLHKRERPFITAADGTKDYIPSNLWDRYEFKTIVATQFHCPITFEDFRLEVRTFAVDHKFPWKANELNDACQKWRRTATQARLWRIAAEIDYVDCQDIRERGQLALKRLVETCFDTTEVSAEFIVAVFNKFIWQVKRKIKGMDITDHIMPVLIGIQGNGNPP